MLCKFTIDNAPVEFELDGEFEWGPDINLFDPQDNAIDGTPWRDEGFTVTPILDAAQLARLRAQTARIVSDALAAAGVPRKELIGFRLEDYHLFAKSDELHRSVILKTRDLTHQDYDIDLPLLMRKVSEVLGGKPVQPNPLLPQELIIVRISRPGSLDINPPHRDGYLDLWKNSVNLWVPVVGCDESSSLPVMPRSHLLNEKFVRRTPNGGAVIAGNKYRVPGIIETIPPMQMIRPNPKPGEALIFTPYIIHGAAINGSRNTTRVSFELRFHIGR